MAQPIEVPDESSSSSHEPKKNLLDKYRGRVDYKGRGKIPEHEQKVIDAYIMDDNLEAAVWDGYGNLVESRFLCELIFGETLVGDVLDSWMCILRSPSFRQHCSHNVWGVSTIVQAEILARAKEVNLHSIKDDDWPGFMERFSRPATRLLGELNSELVENCKYMLIPVHTNFHWFLIAIDLRKRTFIYMNSIMTPKYNGVARTIAAFYCRYLRLGLGCRVDENLYKKKSRQQNGSVDCGVFVCLWAECFAKDTESFWSEAQTIDMDRYRAKMAYTILTHENSRFH